MKSGLRFFSAFLCIGVCALIVAGCSGKEQPKPAEKDPHAGHKHADAESPAKKEEPAKAPAALRPQDTCPVMGGKIDRSIFADYNGKRIYFCCTDCLGTFKGDPEKYMKILEKNGETAEDAPK